MLGSGMWPPGTPMPPPSPKALPLVLVKQFWLRSPWGTGRNDGTRPSETLTKAQVSSAEVSGRIKILLKEPKLNICDLERKNLGQGHTEGVPGTPSPPQTLPAVQVTHH